MNATELDRLIDASLDGEIEPADAERLAAILAADPAAQARHDAARRVFDGLARMPQVHPPEGLAAVIEAVMGSGQVAAISITAAWDAARDQSGETLQAVRRATAHLLG